jgi:hypothetical protein
MSETGGTRATYDKLSLDLNMDDETREDAWRSYEDIRRHYVLQGDQLHWLAVSLYISCRRNDSTRRSANNPISIDRLLKSAHQLPLMVFFEKLHQWEDMANLTEGIRTKIDQVENAFHISSCIFHKYPKMFVDVFGGNEQKYLSIDHQKQRTVHQINPKFAHRTRLRKATQEDFYSLGWTIFALAKTLYPSTYNDLLASFHLLIASLQYLHRLAVQGQFQQLLQGQSRHSTSPCVTLLFRRSFSRQFVVERTTSDGNALSNVRRQHRNGCGHLRRTFS